MVVVGVVAVLFVSPGHPAAAKAITLKSFV